MIQKQDLINHGYFILFSNVENGFKVEIGPKLMDDDLCLVEILEDDTISYYENGIKIMEHQRGESIPIEEMYEKIQDYFLEKFNKKFIFIEKDGHIHGFRNFTE